MWGAVSLGFTGYRLASVALTTREARPIIGKFTGTLGTG